MAVVDWAARAAALRECGQAHVSVPEIAALWGRSRQVTWKHLRQRGLNNPNGRFTRYDAKDLADKCAEWGRPEPYIPNVSPGAFACRVAEWWHLWGADWVSRARFQAAGDNERMWSRLTRRLWQRDVPHERAFGRRYPRLAPPTALLVRLTPDVQGWLAAQGL